MNDASLFGLSPLLWGGIVLLVLVGALALRQRRAVHTPGMLTRQRMPPAAPPPHADDSEDVPAELPHRRDPILGTIAWNGDAAWHNVEPFRFDGRECTVLYLAGPGGPGDEHIAWLEAAVAHGDALALAARTLAANSRAGEVTVDQVVVTHLVMGGDEHERFIGSLSCRMPLPPGPCYVFSRDCWANLSLERG